MVVYTYHSSQVKVIENFEKVHDNIRNIMYKEHNKTHAEEVQLIGNEHKGDGGQVMRVHDEVVASPV
jgi:hypothetical protein